MTMWTPDALAGMRATQEAHMLDTCYLLRYAADPINDYGQPTPVWTNDFAEIACGYSSKSREVMVNTQVVLTDAVVRLPIGTVIDARDRVRVIRRHDELVTPQTFEVLGEPKRGPSGLVLNLRLVTDGSDT